MELFEKKVLVGQTKLGHTCYILDTVEVGKCGIERIYLSIFKYDWDKVVLQTEKDLENIEEKSIWDLTLPKEFVDRVPMTRRELMLYHHTGLIRSMDLTRPIFQKEFEDLTKEELEYLDLALDTKEEFEDWLANLEEFGSLTGPHNLSSELTHDEYRRQQDSRVETIYGSVYAYESLEILNLDSEDIPENLEWGFLECTEGFMYIPKDAKCLKDCDRTFGCAG